MVFFLGLLITDFRVSSVHEGELIGLVGWVNICYVMLCCFFLSFFFAFFSRACTARGARMLSAASTQ